MPSGLAPWTFPRPGLGQRLHQRCGYVCVCLCVCMGVCACVWLLAAPHGIREGAGGGEDAPMGDRTASYLCLDPLCRDIIYLLRTWWQSDTVYFKHTFLCFLI